MNRARILFTLALIACVPPKPPGPPPAGEYTCAEYCAQLARFHCRGAHTTPASVGCIPVCENYQNSGIVKRDFACSMHARSCEEIDECEE